MGRAGFCCVAVAFGAVAACSSYATENGAPDGGLEAGADPTVVDGGGASSADCRFVQDCPALVTQPAGCAVATCTAGKCMYSATDNDFDGHPSAHCLSNNPFQTITLGDDCDDGDPQLFPGHPKVCAESEDGGTIVFPNGTPVGECKAGTKSCTPDGAVTQCVGVVGPKPITSCTPTIDEGCTGNPNQGCACVAGQTQSCGTGVGQCKRGTSSCDTTSSTFGPCVGGTAPTARDCSSALDNDCNGTADNAEPACQCSGGALPGAARACMQHPGLDGIGTCRPGSQTCVTAGGSSSWSNCEGDVGPVADTSCDNVDRDCNGVAAIDEPAPPPPLGTMTCAHLFACPSPKRAPLYYRSSGGFAASANGPTLWTAYATAGGPGGMTGGYRLGHDGSNTKLGPLGISSACCPADNGCNVGTALFSSSGVYLYTTAP